MKMISNILGVPVQKVTMEEVMQRVHKSIASRQRLDIGVVNAAKIVNMKSNPELRAAVLSSDEIYADGASVVFASKLLRQSLPERIAGIDLMFKILEKGDTENYRVYFLGATEEVSKSVEAIVKKTYPGVIVAGRRNGYFSELEEEQIAVAIAASNPDVLFVAITSPKKEKFMAKWSSLLSVPIVHGVGGSFDVMAGKVKRAPKVWQKLGLEWLYRLLQEPRRLWKRYLVTNSKFLWYVLKKLVTGKDPITND